MVPHDNTLPLAPEDRGWSMMRQLQVADSACSSSSMLSGEQTVRHPSADGAG